MYKRRRTTRGRSRSRAKRTIRAVVRSRRRRGLTKKIKSVMYKEVETKQIGYCEAGQASAGDFNVFSLAPIHQESDPSVSINNQQEWNTRHGQQYHLIGFKIDLAMTNFPAGGNPIKPMLARVLILEAAKLRNAATPTSLVPMWIDQTRKNVTFTVAANSMNSMTYTVDRKLFTPKYDRVFKIEGGNGYGIARKKIFCKIQKKINTLQQFEGELAQDKNYYLVWFTFDPSYVGTETVPDYKWTFCWTTYFKDP